MIAATVGVGLYITNDIPSVHVYFSNPLRKYRPRAVFVVITDV